MVEIVRRDQVCEGYIKVEVVTARVGDSEIQRAVESHGRAAAVLPYDPVRKVALLTRQFRAPVKLACGADHLLEAVAGMIDGEDAVEATIRREALEEVGLRLGALERVATGWPSPGVSTETVALFLAAYAPEDRVAAGGGLEGEQEMIEVVETPLHALLNLGAGDATVDMKLLLLTQALRLRRPELFA